MADGRRARERRFADHVGRRESRKLRARRTGSRSVWFGLGMYGLVGWSVALPTIAGVVLGRWIDRTHPGRFSWTLMLLFAGLIVGCWTAWYWVAREQRSIGRDDGPGSGVGEEGEGRA